MANDSTTETAKTIVLVERHLQSEAELMNKLDNANRTLSEMLNDSEMSSFSAEQCAKLMALTEETKIATAQIKQKRATIHALINRGRDEEITLRQFIQESDPASRNRLEQVRQNLVGRHVDANAQLIGNQAVAYYELDHHKQLVSGWFQSDPDEKNYNANGQSLGIASGNLYRRTC